MCSTIGYPGLPPAGHAQTFYSLTSVFVEGHAPPQIHIHIRQLDLTPVVEGDANSRGVPIGKDPKGLSPEEADKALTEEERKTFDDWCVPYFGLFRPPQRKI